MLGPLVRTDRGLEILTFRDAYNQLCFLQQSSLADYETPGSSAIWLGRDEARMHLKIEQVKVLRDHLSAWIESGSFEAGSDDHH